MRGAMKIRAENNEEERDDEEEEGMKTMKRRDE